MLKNKIKNYFLKNLDSKSYLLLIQIYENIRYRKTSLFLGLFVKKNQFFTLNDLKFKFPKSNLYVYGERFKNYELNERILVNNFIKKNDVILDLGGCLGVVSCVANKILISKNSHVVVEPNPKALIFLKFNKKLNLSGFFIEESIVSNSQKEVDFFVSEDFVSSTTYENNYKPQERINIKCITLNELITKYNLDFNTLIIDIEGFEYDFILENEIGIFNKILIEFHPFILGEEKVNECKKILRFNSFNLIQKLGQVEFWEKQN